jgi:cell wall assembly regulator SMI1
MALAERIELVRELLGPSARPGARRAAIAAMQRRLGTRIPDDVAVLVSAFDGSTDATPVRHGWITFWPMDAWQRVLD